MNTKSKTSVLAVAVALVAAFIYPASADQQLTKKWFPGHYIMSSGKISDGEFAGSKIVHHVRKLIAAHPGFAGVRATYVWRELEPAFGVYDFSQIVADLDWAHSVGKKVQVMIMERKFGASSYPLPPNEYPLPSYMMTDPIYDGGVYCGYEPTNGNFSCWPKMWIEPLAERFAALGTALGAAIDSHPALAMISIEESAFVKAAEQPGFNQAAMHNNLMNYHNAISDAFPSTLYNPYLNYRGGLSAAQVEEQVTTLVGNKKIGIGDSDVYIHAPPKTTTVLDKQYGEYWTRYKGIIPFSAEVQRSGYWANTPRMIYDFAIDQVGLNFMVWSPITTWHGDYPFYFDPDVLAVLNEENFRINTTPPSQLLADGAPILSPENLRVVLD